MNPPVIYITLQQFCEHDERPYQVLGDAGFDIRRNTLGRRFRKEDLLQELAGVDAVVAGVEPFDSEVLTRAANLQCISRCGSGVESIDLQAAKTRGIRILTTPDAVAPPVAELTVGMILALARNFPHHLHDFHDGQWKKHTGFLLSEWTIGLIGFGRIARVVESYLRPFEPKMIVADPLLLEHQLPPGVSLRTLDELLAEADLVSLHASRPIDEGVLLGRKEIATMKRGSHIVNTARGHLVDEEALLDALTSGHISSAALDVFGTEPATGPLTKHPHVLCTPHVATLTRASRISMELQAAQNVVDFFTS